MKYRVGGEEEEEEVLIKRGKMPMRSILWTTSRVHSPIFTSESDKPAYTLEDAYAVLRSKTACCAELMGRCGNRCCAERENAYCKLQGVSTA